MKQQRHASAKLLAAVILLATAGGAMADPPELTRYQARLADDAGFPLSGNHSLIFRIFDAETNGAELWNESWVVTIEDGALDVLLGSNTPLPSSVFGSADRWLELSLNGEVLQPRERFGSVPYAQACDRLGDKRLNEVLDRTAHTGVQPPSTIGPQGSGSALDADLLDGLNANEIIDAASQLTCTDLIYQFGPIGESMMNSGQNAQSCNDTMGKTFFCPSGSTLIAVSHNASGGSSLGLQPECTTLAVDSITTKCQNNTDLANCDNDQCSTNFGGGDPMCSDEQIVLTCCR